MMTAFILFTFGDMTCQTLEQRTQWDYMRTLRMASVAGIILNPISQVYLNKIVPHLDLRTTFPSKAGHVFNSFFRGLSHFLFMGTLANSSQLFLPAFLKNLDFQEGYLNWNSKVVYSMQVGAAYWPLLHFLNYQFIPNHLRQLFVDSMAFFYAIFLSYLSNKAVHSQILHPSQEIT